MDPVVPAKLKRGDRIRVIAPSRSLEMISATEREIATRRLEDELGLQISFGEHVDEADAFLSSGVESRIADLHAAFADPNVAAVLTVIGGFNSNQLLPHIDWELIAANPKVFCGYSDITALQNALLARADLVTYSGPHYSSFGMKRHFEPTQRWFLDCLFTEGPIELQPAAEWSDDEWWLDQEDRKQLPNEGWWVLSEGSASGRIVGANLCTLNLLQGTAYMPPLEDAVVFVEDDAMSKPHTFDRDLTSLTQQPGFEGVRGVAIGRFEPGSEMSRALFEQIVATNPRLSGLPVIANLDFGHTFPLITFPIGGRVEVEAVANRPRVCLTVH